MKEFNIKKNGLVQGGKASYQFDEPNKITWNASIKVGIGFLAKKYEKSGTLLLDNPDVMLSINLKLGVEKQFGPVVLSITNDGEAFSMCKIKVNDPQIDGEILISKANKYLEPKSGLINAKVSGLTLALEFEPA